MNGMIGGRQGEQDMFKEDHYPYETNCPKCSRYTWHKQGYDTDNQRRMVKCTNCGYERDEMYEEETEEGLFSER